MYLYSFGHIHGTPDLTGPSATSPLRIVRVGSEDSKSVTELFIQQGMLVLQTGKRPFVFNHFTFHTDQWYHVVVTHNKSMLSTQGSCSLFVNGNAVQEGRLPYITSVSPTNLQATIGTSPEFAKEGTSLSLSFSPSFFLSFSLT